jgi:phospholipid/cholesterol/gamma-HCH transport system permease protein
MPLASTKPSAPGIAVQHEGDRLALAGVLDVQTLPAAEHTLKDSLQQKQSRVLDVSKLDRLDSSGALFLCTLRDAGVGLEGIRGEHRALIDLVCGLDLETLPKPEHVPRWRQLVIELGRSVDEFLHDTIDFITFVGRATSSLAQGFAHPRSLRCPSISRQIKETGIDALPIVGLLAVMIAIVIAYQGVVQLRPYGGEDFTINLVAVSVLREMGVLITAIIVAGRSGSAFTAEIGVMEAREEVDALKVMGLEPMELLVVPRLIALVITLPLLTFFSDIMGLVGGAIMTHSQLDISAVQYLDRAHQAVDMSDLGVGIVKAPVFAFVIGVVGCMHGLRVRGSAESVGKETTRAVVKSIFLVIVLDALFSILFEKLGL